VVAPAACPIEKRAVAQWELLALRMHRWMRSLVQRGPGRGRSHPAVSWIAQTACVLLLRRRAPRSFGFRKDPRRRQVRSTAQPRSDKFLETAAAAGGAETEPGAA